MSIALYNDLLFTSKNFDPKIYVLDRQTNNQITNIGDLNLAETRKYMFINNGEIMIAIGPSFMILTMFRVNLASNYTVEQFLAYPFPTVHRLAKVNDTLFYASIWTNRRIVAYRYQNATWSSKSFVNATGSGSAAHITVDECGRICYIIGSFDLRIFDSLIWRWHIGI
ncbi:unnamed protein product [Rotaria sp. Silwood1]|nr:unnamed protein product [Rotaria sp. Silwood1]CAF0901187.1 unnamed protein product [Rotaria sp. Silwood1]CAF3371013.1 unnamed protein product [Rotaria sp. Silwood1]CAF3390173.1 unnamed protein product [Rotaria sp. Silwood1]CAF3390860.1 unnamed protein product [Rotaria sp. Silwood1]